MEEFLLALFCFVAFLCLIWPSFISKVIRSLWLIVFFLVLIQLLPEEMRMIATIIAVVLAIVSVALYQAPGTKSPRGRREH